MIKIICSSRWGGPRPEYRGSYFDVKLIPQEGYRITRRLLPVFFRCTTKPEPKDSHITWDDVERIGKHLVGLRHVSSEEAALHDKNEGVSNGCSLSISFCDSDGVSQTGVPFKDLDERRGDSKALLAYEEAISRFIKGSIKLDAASLCSFQDFINLIQTTHFLVVATGFGKTTDNDQYYGLGRFAKERIPANKVWLLPRIEVQDFGECEEQHSTHRLTYTQYKRLMTHLIVLYRKTLLEFLRVSFEPENFQKHWGYYQALRQKMERPA
ncbi:MAG: hypothetical protein A3F09_04500 [Chlamydiae bacterium RIFCSPHIGHO2_12_FULL_49_11]|nr:MAG: hypothetical protein A3F09_04500 [Chlamydiae bacterium RIFCSPHIGHO2_12_FULL_49_11]